MVLSICIVLFVPRTTPKALVSHPPGALLLLPSRSAAVGPPKRAFPAHKGNRRAMSALQATCGRQCGAPAAAAASSCRGSGRAAFCARPRESWSFGPAAMAPRPPAAALRVQAAAAEQQQQQEQEQQPRARTVPTRRLSSQEVSGVCGRAANDRLQPRAGQERGRRRKAKPAPQPGSGMPVASPFPAPRCLAAPAGHRSAVREPARGAARDLRRLLLVGAGRHCDRPCSDGGAAG